MVLFLLGGLLPATHGQSFVNLDFESAQIVPVSGEFPNAIAAAQALPGWTVFDGQQETNISYNTLGPSFFMACLSRKQIQGLSTEVLA